jgi:hypothetical protein
MQICKQLKDYGRTLLPFTLLSNSTKFDIKQAVKFLLKHYGSWPYVTRGEKGIVAAMCDGGDLA